MFAGAQESFLCLVTSTGTVPWSGRSRRYGTCGHVAVDLVVKCIWFLHIEAVTETSDRPVVHSDRGGHYRWPDWLSRMSDANLNRSMSRKACSPDNAACEGFFGRLKNELFYPRG